LRIYGAQTKYLINRAAEIHVLGRLAQKKLGPRVLGIFTNGRFEEYFSARPLTIVEMCETETSVQIAQQLRELHDGLPLNDKDLDSGPFIWCIWDKWVERCEEVCTVLDAEILKSDRTADEGRGNSWRERGLICGTEWAVFRRTVERYREFLYENYGGPEGTRTNLIFAHNDVNQGHFPLRSYLLICEQVKYDNILRLEPGGESLLPQRSSPLVLIDFEYSGANFRGFDFANHFVSSSLSSMGNCQADSVSRRNGAMITIMKKIRPPSVRSFIQQSRSSTDLLRLMWNTLTP
jgi:choline kinase